MSESDLDPGIPEVRPDVRSITIEVLSAVPVSVVIAAETEAIEVTPVRGGGGNLRGVRVYLGVRHFKERWWVPGRKFGERWPATAPISDIYVYHNPLSDTGAYVDIWFFPDVNGAAVSSRRSKGTLILEFTYPALHG